MAQDLRIISVDISNFRSIRRLTLDAKDLTALVGYNDCGKSNVLRALNLFFNEETNPGERLNFTEDYNFYVPKKERRAKEIIVRLELEVPPSYRSTNGDFISWERRWRADGLPHSSYTGYRTHKSKRTGKLVRDDVPIPPRSNMHSLLAKVEYFYVPAIKDALFFDALRGRIYSIISEVAAATFRKSSSSFEQAIGDHLSDLTADIQESLGFETKLALPRDLSHVFERLDFLSGAGGVSLENRGDGIKARHIPLIMKFMADKKRSLQVRGAMPPTFIWGYEEPENNLEFTSAVNLAKGFQQYASEGVAQILLTTHSPVFYNAAREDELMSMCHHIWKTNSEDGTQGQANASDLDLHMGTMALFAPLVADLESRFSEQENARREAEKLAESVTRKIVVEGTSDKIFFERLFEAFAPAGERSQISIETKDGNGGGHSYVIDTLAGWHLVKKYKPQLHRAAGVVDADEDAVSKLREWNGAPDHVRSAKCFKLPNPPRLHGLFGKGFKFQVCLEDMYPEAIWQWAQKKGYLEARSIKHILPSDVTDRILNGDLVPDGVVPKAHEILIRNRVSYAEKVRLAKHVTRKGNVSFSQDFEFLKPLVLEIIDYLFPEE